MRNVSFSKLLHARVAYWLTLSARLCPTRLRMRVAPAAPSYYANRRLTNSGGAARRVPPCKCKCTQMGARMHARTNAQTNARTLTRTPSESFADWSCGSVETLLARPFSAESSINSVTVYKFLKKVFWVLNLCRPQHWRFSDYGSVCWRNIWDIYLSKKI